MGKPIAESVRIDVTTPPTHRSGTPRRSTRSTTRSRPPAPTRWHDHPRAARSGRRGRPVELPADHRPAGSSARRWPPATASCSSPPSSPRWPRSGSRRSPPRPGSPTGCSTWSRARGEAGEALGRHPTSTRSPSPARAGWPVLPGYAGSPTARRSPRGGRQEPAARARRRADLEAVAQAVAWGDLLQRRADLQRGLAAGGRRSVREPLVERIADDRRAAAGRPARPRDQMGAIVDEANWPRSLGYIERAATTARGRSPAAAARGAVSGGTFVEPTVLDGVDTSVVGQEEIFGPVLAVVPAGDVDEGVRLANETSSGSSPPSGPGTSHRAPVSRRLRAGTVWINTFDAATSSPPSAASRPPARAATVLHALERTRPQDHLDRALASRVAPVPRQEAPCRTSKKLRRGRADRQP